VTGVQTCALPIYIVEPDLLFVSAGRAAILKDKNVQGAPDLAIEILSPSTRRRDLSAKRVRYGLLGVREYWGLDPDRDTATVFRRAEGADSVFEPPVLLSAEAGDRLTSPLLPGLEIELAKLFSR
jgi:Uma2 family endonuclease